jgi:hypothetical protein
VIVVGTHRLTISGIRKAVARGITDKKKGEQSSPKVSLKPLSAGSKLWIRFQTTFRDVGTFVLFFLRDADWCNETNDLERHEVTKTQPKIVAAPMS